MRRDRGTPARASKIRTLPRAGRHGARAAVARASVGLRSYRRDLLARARRIRLVILDVDGVLTDGRLYYGPDGEALKAFDVRDGHGVVLLRDHLDFAVISGRPGGASQRRLEELRFKHLIFAERNKLEGYARLAPLGLADDEVAYMGDDVNDVPLLRRVGLAACPADARPEARAVAHFVASAPGGRGAVRELCDLLLRAKGIAAP